MTDLTIEHSETGEHGRFFLRRAGAPCGTLDYSLADGAVQIEYVEVAPESRGSGLGRRLVEAAVQWARDTDRKVVPICPYAAMVLRDDPRLHDVLGPS